MRVDLSLPATQAALAKLVGVSQPTVSNLISEGKLPAVGTLGELGAAYCQRLRDQAAGRMGSGLGGLDLVQERAALAREQRLGIEIKNAALRTEFAPVALLSEVLATTSGAIADCFDLLPARIDAACPGLPDEARRVVMAALNSARSEWVRATAFLVVANDDGDQDDAAAQELKA